MKKILSFALSLALMLCIVPVSYIAAESVVTSYTDGYYTYTITDSKASIEAVDTAISGDITIPSVLGGYPVTSIGFAAFKDCTYVKSITIPVGIKKIGSFAFEDCSSLESINVDPQNAYYESKGNCLIEKSTKVLIKGCNTSVIPSDGSVTSIGEWAFYNCSDLTNITIPDCVVSIEYNAFYATAYYNNEGNWKNGLLYIGNHLIKANKHWNGCAIKEGTKTIAGGAFEGHSDLKNISIPKGVTNIGVCAFAGCSNLTSLIIPTSVISIGNSAFASCSSLADVYYNGTQEDALKIIFGSNVVDSIENITFHFIEDYITNNWFKFAGEWYYGKNGDILKNQWMEDSNGWCYLSSDGAMVTNDWVRDSIGWCYVGANGYIVKNNWVKDGGKWYHLNASGYMESNKWMKDSKGWCYLGADGAMKTNAWVKDSNGWC